MLQQAVRARLQSLSSCLGMRALLCSKRSCRHGCILHPETTLLNRRSAEERTTASGPTSTSSNSRGWDSTSCLHQGHGMMLQQKYMHLRILHSESRLLKCTEERTTASGPTSTSWNSTGWDSRVAGAWAGPSGALPGHVPVASSHSPASTLLSHVLTNGGLLWVVSIAMAEVVCGRHGQAGMRDVTTVSFNTADTIQVLVKQCQGTNKLACANLTVGPMPPAVSRSMSACQRAHVSLILWPACLQWQVHLNMPSHFVVQGLGHLQCQSPWGPTGCSAALPARCPPRRWQSAPPGSGTARI